MDRLAHRAIARGYHRRGNCLVSRAPGLPPPATVRVRRGHCACINSLIRRRTCSFVVIDSQALLSKYVTSGWE